MFIKIKSDFRTWDLQEATQIKYYGYEEGSGEGSPDMEFSWGSYPSHISDVLSKYDLDKIEVLDYQGPRAVSC